MKRKGIKEFILRVLLAASPLALFLALYVVLDPFGVVHRYDGVSVESGDSLERIPNKRYVAVEGLKYHSLERHYDSFIFGSSLSTNFTARQWVRHLPDSAHTVPTSTTSRRVRNPLRASVTSCVTCSTMARTSGMCCW